LAETVTKLDEKIAKAVEMANRVGQVFISTADADGWPHMAAARRIRPGKDARIDVMEWFCPGTMSNLQKNRKVAVVVWDAKEDSGYQVFGEMERMMDIGVIDGYTPSMDQKWPMPQIESQLVVRVTKVTDFKRAPHSDIAE
jgi:hypothetical protein